MGGGGGGYQERHISAFYQVPFFCLMCGLICLLYRVIQDFVQKAEFSRYRQLEVGGVNM